MQDPRERGRFKALLLAIIVHSLFFGLLLFGVSWQNKQPEPLEVELWEELPAASAQPPDSPKEARSKPAPRDPKVTADIPSKPEPKAKEPRIKTEKPQVDTEAKKLKEELAMAQRKQARTRRRRGSGTT